VKIALDATPLTMTSGGLPRYVSELTAALIAAFPEDQFTLSSDQPFESTLQRLPGPANWLERRWWLYGAERANTRAGVSLYHGTNFSIPYFAQRPTVLTIHDLSPWMNPAWHSGADRVRKHTPRMVARATMMITPSRSVREQVIERFQVQRERTAVTPLAAASIFRPTLKAGAKTSAKPYFLFVGTLEPRKNIPLLLEAWRDVRKNQDVDLIIAGRKREDFPAIGPEPGLQILGETPEESLPELYSNAIAVIYPSQYEGFGLPVLEAMQCGSPVIISNDPALREVSGGAALQAATPAEMANAMRTLINDPQLRAGRATMSLARAGEFSWSTTARLTYDIYREAFDRFGR
jgi:glycosyltransferase involved in cell wall biosynthesis